MKKLSVEEKAIAYDKALDVCRKLYNKAKADGFISLSEAYEKIFPELAESEDEKIRKAIHIYLDWLDGLNKDYQPKGNYTIKDMIAWLEKQGKITKEWSEMKFNNINTELQEMVDLKLKTEQGEQKPAWSEADEEQLSFCCAVIELSNYSSDEYRNHAISFLESLKDRVYPQPQQKWNEEDEKTLSLLHNIIEHHYSLDIIKKDEQLKLEDFLKQLRPQNRWKPSEEQIEALHDAIIYVKDSMFPSKNVLKKLYGQLKKLREEDV